MTQPFPPVTSRGEPEPQLIDYTPLARRVDVWWCDLRSAAAAWPNLGSCLSADERARAARFGTPELRERYITGRSLLRRVLTRYVGGAPEDVPIRRGLRGRPQLDALAGPDFNVTHTGLTAVFAIGHHLAPGQRVGVDVESAARTLNVARLARKLLTAEEHDAMSSCANADDARLRFLRTWTCKEAMSKATGDGLRAPFGRIAVAPDEPPRVLAGPPPYTPEAWQLSRVPLPGDAIVTVAVWQS